MGILLRTIAFTITASLLLLTGCATSDSKFQTKRYLFPKPPDPPKLEWLKSYYSQQDFPKSNVDSLTDTLFGENEAIIFQKPMDIKSNGKGIIYITDVVTKAIYVYDLKNYKISLWKQTSGNDNLLAINPYYISLDTEENIYVVGAGASKIFVLNPKGVVINRIDFAAKIKRVAGIVVDNERNRIYLVDAGGSKIEVFKLNGEHLFSFGKPGEADGELNNPSPITINSKGEVIVGDTFNGRVQIFDGDGKFLRKFGERGDNVGAFEIIKGIAVDSDDNIYVTDGKANKVKIFSSKGELLYGLGVAHSVSSTQKEAPGGFLLPQGIHIDKTDTIYIADQANNRFQVYKYLKDEPAPTADSKKK